MHRGLACVVFACWCVLLVCVPFNGILCSTTKLYITFGTPLESQQKL